MAAAASSSPNCYQNGGLHTAVILIIFLLISLPSKPVGLGFPSYKNDESEKEKEKLVGSRPPGCVNRCLNCQPCMATLVIQPHHRQWNNERFSKTTSPHEEGDSYYLLSWKCKCRNKLFHPYQTWRA